VGQFAGLAAAEVKRAMEDMQAQRNEIDEELRRLRKLATLTRSPSTALKPRSLIRRRRWRHFIPTNE
jgi:hypothetical protein